MKRTKDLFLDIIFMKKLLHYSNENNGNIINQKQNMQLHLSKESFGGTIKKLQLI